MAVTFSSASVLQVVEGSQGATVTTLNVVSAIGGEVPFTAGLVFQQGQITQAAGSSSLGATQWTTKNNWPDGSVKIGQMSGIVTLTPNQALALDIQDTTLTQGAELSTTDLIATGLSASVEVEGYGAASWSDADWDNPYETWISGPVMSSWRYFKRIDTSTWLTAWLEIRLYANGQISILPSLENGYLFLSGRGIREGRVIFRINGAVRFDTTRIAHIYDHARYLLAENGDGWHWVGTDYQVRATQNTQDMMATRLVPHYPFSAPSESVLNAKSQTISSFVLEDQSYFTEQAHGTATNLPRPMTASWGSANLSSAEVWHSTGALVNSRQTAQLRITGTWSGTLTWQRSLNGTVWEDVQTFTANHSGAVHVDRYEGTRYYRVGFKSGAYVAGTARVDHGVVTKAIGTGFSAAGYAPWIGVLPEWDAMFLTSNGDRRAYYSMLAHHAGVGLCGMHFRCDDLSGDLYRWSEYPKLSQQQSPPPVLYYPNESDLDNPPFYINMHYHAYYGYSMTHGPQVGFLPYLVTGAKYWCEETMFVANILGMGMSAAWRTGETLRGSWTDAQYLKMIIWSDSCGFAPRGAAWTWRSMATGLCAAPAGSQYDVWRQDFKRSIINSATYALNNGVRGTGQLGPNFVNNLGILPQRNSDPVGGYSVPYQVNSYPSPVWMDAFWVAAIGYCWDLCQDLFTTEERSEYLLARDFAYKKPVGMTSLFPGGWNWREAGNGVIPFSDGLYIPGSPVDNPSTSTFKESYEAIYLHALEFAVSNQCMWNGGRAQNAPAAGTSKAISGSGAGSAGRAMWIDIHGKWASGTKTPTAWTATVKLQSSPDNVTWTDVPGKVWAINTAEEYNDGLIGQTVYYRLIVKPEDYISGDIVFRFGTGTHGSTDIYELCKRFSEWDSSSVLGGSLRSFAYLGWIGAQSYWANFLPSIAYAADHDAPGARDGWARIMSASNVDEIMSNASEYRNQPVWGIRPRSWQ